MYDGGCVKTRGLSSILATKRLESIFPYKVASLPRLVTAAKVPDMAAQLQGMFKTLLVVRSGGRLV